MKISIKLIILLLITTAISLSSYADDNQNNNSGEPIALGSEGAVTVADNLANSDKVDPCNTHAEQLARLDQSKSQYELQKSIVDPGQRQESVQLRLPANKKKDNKKTQLVKKVEEDLMIANIPATYVAAFHPCK